MNPVKSGHLLRAVADTNVYISAFLHPDRPIFYILQRAAEGHYCLLISPAIMREVGRVLRETFKIDGETRTRHLKVLVKITEMVTPQITLNVIPEDPPDDRILECAVEGKANLIISGNRHLQRLKIYVGITEQKYNTEELRPARKISLLPLASSKLVLPSLPVEKLEGGEKTHTLTLPLPRESNPSRCPSNRAFLKFL